MKELIKDILILVKAIYSDAELKNNKKIEFADFFTYVLPIEKDDLSLNIGYDSAGRSYDDYKDLYRYKLLVKPQGWGFNKCIRLMYDIKKDTFLYQTVYVSSGAARRFDDENLLKHIYDVLKQIEESVLT